MPSRFPHAEYHYLSVSLPAVRPSMSWAIACPPEAPLGAVHTVCIQYIP